VPVSVGSVCRTSLTDVGALSFPVRRNDPSVAGVRAAHILNEPVPTADGEATVIVFVHDGVYPRVTGRDARELTSVITADIRTSLARSPVGKERPCRFSATATTSSCVAGKLVPLPARRVTCSCAATPKSRRPQ
jgi:hypothetical protein